MRLKQKIALLLTGVMLAGSIGVINPVEVEAGGTANTFTLTVPGNTTITKSGWNSIGNVGISNVLINTGNTIEVTIERGATGRTLKKSGETSKTVGYDIYKGSTSRGDAFGDKLEFTENGTQAIGADVEDFTGKEDGTYTDTINFTATLKEAISAENFPLSNSNAKVLKASDLLASKTAEVSTYSTFEYSGATYTAYNGYISETAYANWNEAQNFVAELNKVELDGKTGGWTLLKDKDMAYAWWQSTRSSDDKNREGVYYGQSSFGDVNTVWTVGELRNYGYACGCADAWSYAKEGLGENDVKGKCWLMVGDGKSASKSTLGFVVLRESESTGVEYELQGSSAPEGKKLTSAALLASKTAEASTYSTFTYDSTTYTAYNGYVSETAGANWTDAKNFVEELNKVELDGRIGGWTLLTDKDMAYAWWLSTDSAENKGASSFDGVHGVWSSGSRSGGYYWNCNNARNFADSGKDATSAEADAWTEDYKSRSNALIGFVVLRGSTIQAD